MDMLTKLLHIQKLG